MGALGKVASATLTSSSVLASSLAGTAVLAVLFLLSTLPCTGPGAEVAKQRPLISRMSSTCGGATGSSRRLLLRAAAGGICCKGRLFRLWDVEFY